MEFGRYQAEDGTEIRYGVRRVPKGRPLVLATGRGEFIEKYEEVIERLNARGFSVWTFDWRGQGLSTRPLSNRQKGHVASFEQFLNDMHGWLNQVVLPGLETPPILVAHSMGGHLGLRYLADYPEVFRRAVIIAPLVRFRGGWVATMMTLALRVLNWIGLGGWYFLKGDYEPDAQVFEGNLLTSDPERFQIKPRCVRENPQLAQGGVTIRWLVAAADSIRRLHQRVKGITARVLLVAPTEEGVVDGSASTRLLTQVVAGEVVDIPGARHEVLFERDEIQATFWTAFDRFTEVR